MTKRALCVGINGYSARSDCVTLPDARPVPHVCLSDPSALQDNVSVTRNQDGSLQMRVEENLNFSDSAKATLLAACLYDQNSSGTGSHGCFTQALIDTINQCGMQIMHPNLLTQVREAISKYTSSQVP